MRTRSKGKPGFPSRTGSRWSQEISQTHMLARTYSATCTGIEAQLVEIEVDVANGLPQMALVGLPDQAVRESKERVRSALANSGFLISPKKVTINLAPADTRKEGPSYDLAIAIGILAASGFVKTDRLERFIFTGELALDGALRKIRGALPIAQMTRQMGRSLVCPEENTAEAALEESASLFPASSLKQVAQWINEEEPLKEVRGQFRLPNLGTEELEECNFSEVRGQFQAKRAAEIAASGGHNLLLIGPPGGGKTMIAKRIPTILPGLLHHEYLEIAKIHSAAGLAPDGSCAVTRRPFRSPHHTTSQIGLVGGGSTPRPGEITLAHGGVLFLDEFPEFRRDAIESLRAPMEEGRILISRAKNSLIFPARFLMVCAMNPCPCGYLTSSKRACRCTMTQIQKYHQKISGPILDRIDLHVELPAIDYQALAGHEPAEPSSEIRKRVLGARAVQTERFAKTPGRTNALMSPREIKTYCAATESARRLLERAMKELGLSARGYHKILKIARTIADLAECEQIQEEHIAEAIQYRTLDRNWFG